MPNIKNLGPFVSDKNIFHVFSIYVYTKHVTLGVGPIFAGGGGGGGGGNIRTNYVEVQ